MHTGGTAESPAETTPPAVAEAGRRPVFALVGNPNSGKTTLFNALTGLRQKVGNYPGVTVERKEGTVSLPDTTVTLIDLPGLYSLTPHSPDERIARDVLLGYRTDVPRPQAIVNVVDASNLERNLYLTSQLLDLGLPVLVVLTMTDTAREHGVGVNAEALSEELGVPVCVTLAARRIGMESLLTALQKLPTQTLPPQRHWRLPQPLEVEAAELAGLLRREKDVPVPIAFQEALQLLSRPEVDEARWSAELRHHLHGDLQTLNQQGIDVSVAIAEARYGDIGRVVSRVLEREPEAKVTLSDRLDRVFLHKFWGYVIFLSVMYLMFQAMFTWATPAQDALEGLVNALGQWVSSAMPDGDLKDLVVNGVLGGVGNTVVFLPQILILFFFVSALEDTGYLARAAFLMDRLMSRVGLHGKSFIPLLSSYGCAIPGIMATRTIESERARLLTILVAPLMSCSARLPVYSVMIAAFIPNVMVTGFLVGNVAIGLTLPALTLFAMYAVGTAATFGMAALFNRTLLKGDAPTFLMEMPPYRLPSIRTVLYQMFERAWLFLKRAGTIILAISIVLWFLASYPKTDPTLSKAEQVRQSYAGQMGRAIEPLIAPLGFDWKIGIGLISSFAAREVFVTAMGTIYNVSEEIEDEQKEVAVGEKMKADINPRTGQPTFTPLVAVALMVYYVLAMQCMSTVAVVRRETGSWKWTLFQIAYMTALAWFTTLLVYQIGRLFGWG
jgi:ferrous iron transport protein B